MPNFRAKDQQKGSPKTEVGEIDTRAPFQSVRAAVSLFGEVVSSKDKQTVKRNKQLSSEVFVPFFFPFMGNLFHF